MFQVLPERIEALLPLFADPPPNAPMLQAYFEKRAPGRAFVETPRDPGGCLIAMNYRFVFLGGEVSRALMREAIARLRREQPLDVVWPLQRALPRGVPQPDVEVERVEYRRRHDPDGSLIRSLAQRMPGMEIRRIDATMIRRCLWRKEVKSAKGTVREFFQNGIGFCLMCGERIAAEAYACFWTADRSEIAVITHPDFRRRGCATILCAHLIAACEPLGFAPYWSCEADNDSSRRLADRLGFTEPRSYRLLRYEREPMLGA